MDTALKAQIVDILSKAADLTIATVRPDGWPQATTVSFVHAGMLIYFGTGAGSQKARNIAACPKVSITVDLPYRAWDEIAGLSLAGLAERVTDAAELGHVGQLMLAKFPQLTDFLMPGGEAPAMYRVTPTVISVLDYAKGFGHTEQIAFETDGGPAIA